MYIRTDDDDGTDDGTDGRSEDYDGDDGTRRDGRRTDRGRTEDGQRADRGRTTMMGPTTGRMHGQMKVILLCISVY